MVRVPVQDDPTYLVDQRITSTGKLLPYFKEYRGFLEMARKAESLDADQQRRLDVATKYFENMRSKKRKVFALPTVDECLRSSVGLALGIVEVVNDADSVWPPAQRSVLEQAESEGASFIISDGLHHPADIPAPPTALDILVAAVVSAADYSTGSLSDTQHLINEEATVQAEIKRQYTASFDFLGRNAAALDILLTRRTEILGDLATMSEHMVNLVKNIRLAETDLHNVSVSIGKHLKGQGEVFDAESVLLAQYNRSMVRTLDLQAHAEHLLTDP